MTARPKQRHIECFLEIVRKGSIGAAADSLSLTQPAVSRTLADLEAMLNARLLERSRGGVTLTTAGETFLRYASGSASALDKGIKQVARIRRDARQAVNVGVLPNVAARLLSKAVSRFKQTRRDVSVRVATGTNRGLTQGLRQGDLDFVLGRLAAPEDMTDLVFDPLYKGDLVAVVRHDHVLLATHDVAEIGVAIAGHTIILPQAGTIIREDAEQLLLSLGAGELEDTIETLSVEFGRAYVEMTSAIWITPRGTVQQSIDAGFLAVLPLDVAATRGTVGITTRSGLRLSGLGEELAGIIRRSPRRMIKR